MADESVDSTHSHSNHGSPLPNVNERLAQLRPSKELLEYYRRKIAEFDNEHQEMLAKLEKYKCTYEEQHKLQWELRQREEEIAELQKALSDMQVYLFQERENVLRLYAENDRLKIRELEDRKKIQHLLSLTKPTDTEITYFIKDHPVASAISKSKITNKKDYNNKDLNQGRGPGGHRKGCNKTQVVSGTSKQPYSKKQANSTASTKDASTDMQMLLLQIESLQAQIEEQAKLAKEQEESLLEDRRVQMEEQAAQRQRDSEKIKALTEHLHKTQTLLYESTKDFLELKYEGRLKERRWMMERDKIMQEMDSIKEQLEISKSDIEVVQENTHYVDASTGPDHIAMELKPTTTMIISSLKSSLLQAQRLSEMYREQVIGLEDELARIREENDVGKDIFQDRTEKMTNRLQLMNQRYEALEKRRSLEVEGFKNDIKLLRAKLKEVEKQLFKVTVNLGDQFDFEILQHARKTSGRSKRVVDELRNLKSKIYSMENDVKHLQV